MKKERTFAKGGVKKLTECKYSHKSDGDRAKCTHSTMVLHVGLYCDPATCEKVKKGEIKAI
jgi:hypothetical protein